MEKAPKPFKTFLKEGDGEREGRGWLMQLDLQLKVLQHFHVLEVLDSQV